MAEDEDVVVTEDNVIWDSEEQEVLTVLDSGQLYACRDDGVVIWSGVRHRWERSQDALQEEVFDSAGLNGEFGE